MNIDELMGKEFVLQTTSEGSRGKCQICNKRANGKIVVEPFDEKSFIVCDECVNYILNEMVLQNCDVRISAGLKNNMIYARKRNGGY